MKKSTELQSKFLAEGRAPMVCFKHFICRTQSPTRHTHPYKNAYSPKQTAKDTIACLGEVQVAHAQVGTYSMAMSASIQTGRGGATWRQGAPSMKTGK